MTIDMQRMSREEKLKVMHALWEDLAREEDAIESPAWHGDALRETEERDRPHVPDRTSLARSSSSVSFFRSAKRRKRNAMEIDERIISKAIVERYYHKLLDHLEVDVAIVGGGPAGLVAGYYLARAGRKIALYERKLSVGGGMWGGGMMFNEIVVQETALDILDEFGVRHREYDRGYHTADSVEAISTLISRAVQAGVSVFNCISVEDVLMRPDRVVGVVLNWSAVQLAGLHVDPLAVRARFVVDASGHAAEVVKVVQNKVSGRLATPSGKIEGEKSMWSEEAETLTLKNTREVFPGLFVAGMSANATLGGPRMGAIFGGMLLSGKKVADLLLAAMNAPSDQLKQPNKICS